MKMQPIRQSGELGQPRPRSALGFLIDAISAGGPYWHQPTQASPSYDEHLVHGPARTCACLASRFWAAV